MLSNQSKTPLEELDTKLKKVNARKHDQRKGVRSDEGFGVAIRIGVDIVAALAVGVGIGLFLDNWLNTKPWMLILFFILGSAAGLLNVFRSISGHGYAAGYISAQPNNELNSKSNRHLGSG
ncbi:MAG: AtpZ/AtpI family protein [Pseudomonadota bacterium]|nr:AtpZ/AtpI family protein [Pseudomonadota bacterium]